MEKYLRFIRNISKAENKSKRYRRRLMERELNKLNNDKKASGGGDGHQENDG